MITPEERATAVCRDSRWTIEPWKYDLIVNAIRAAEKACQEEIINLRTVLAGLVAQLPQPNIGDPDLDAAIDLANATLAKIA